MSRQPPACRRSDDPQVLPTLKSAKLQFHGDWNYTLLPAPRPAPPPEPPRPARPDPATLADLAAIAGLTTQDLDDLAAGLSIAWHAQLEAQLYQARGGPRRHTSGAGHNRTLDLPGDILVTTCTTATAPPATPWAP